MVQITKVRVDGYRAEADGGTDVTDARGQGRAARDLTATRLGGVEIATLIAKAQQMVKDNPQFIECDKVTGDDCFIARLYVRSIEELDEIVDRIADKADTNTAIVKSQPLKRRLPPL